MKSKFTYQICGEFFAFISVYLFVFGGRPHTRWTSRNHRWCQGLNLGWYDQGRHPKIILPQVVLSRLIPLWPSQTGTGQFPHAA